MARKKPDLMKALDATHPEEAVVKIGYGDIYELPIRILDFKSGYMDADTAADVIRLVPSYNEFDGDAVAAAVKKLGKEGLIDNLQFGREGSPVLYVSLRKWDSAAAKRKLKKIFVKDLKADEFNEEFAGRYRIWWD